MKDIKLRIEKGKILGLPINYTAKLRDVYEVKMTFYRPITQRLGIRRIKKIQEGKLIPCDSVQDIDNLVKPILDMLTKLIWNNDRKVFRLIAEKFFSTKEYVDIEIKIFNY